MKTLWVVSIWPEPKSSAGGTRTAQLIEACRSLGHTIEIVSPAHDTPFRSALHSAGYLTHRFEPNDSRFDEYLHTLKPDIVFFDRFMIEEQFGWRVQKYAPQALRVLDTIDLHFLRRAREHALKNGVDPLSLSFEDLSTDDARREIASILRSDLTLVVSDFESELLQNTFHVPSFLLTTLRFYATRLNSTKFFDKREGFATIGNFNHAPNVDSVRYLHKEIWPRLRKKFLSTGLTLPNLHIYGAYPTQEFLSLSDPANGFIVHGLAEDAPLTLSEHRVTLAPLRFGAGIKGKIIDSWCAGSPAITTSIGAEGMHEYLPWGGSIADSPDDFVEAAYSMYTNKALWDDAQQKGYAILDTVYVRDEIEKKFGDAIKEAYTQRETRRSQNFFGSILWHSTQRSTEYMSRWIEEKNKRAT